MDKSISDLNERHKSASVHNVDGGSPGAYVNGSMRRPCSMGGNRGASLLDGGASPTGAHHHSYGLVLRVVVNRDDRGYGMKVSGDKPVYVQSVKEGGAAEKAGLHADDKIIQVNGVDVMESTHTEVVALIRSSNQVVLTVQQKPRMMNSPSLHVRPMPIQSSTRITGPKPVDNEKLRQIQKEREQTIRLMLEEEQRYVDALRSDIARSPGDEKKNAELTNAKRNVATLQNQLQAILVGVQNTNSEPSFSPSKKSLAGRSAATLPFAATGESSPKSGVHTLPSKTSKTSSKSSKHSRLPHSHSASFTIPECNENETPPPLPKRNKTSSTIDSAANFLGISTTNLAGVKFIRSPSASPSRDITTMFLDNEINNSNIRNNKTDSNNKNNNNCTKFGVIQQNTMFSEIPPPLPPRVPLPSSGNNTDTDAVNSINKQMSYPLVATCATLVNNYPAPHVSPHTHHRTKSSPDPLGTAIPTAQADRRLLASESLNDLTTSPTSRPTSTGDGGWDANTATPPGTPPPPYPSPIAGKKHLGRGSNRNSSNTEDGDCYHDESELSPEISPLRGVNSSSVLATSSPIVAATPNTVQQPIISMEDDEISDQEILEDHGPFKSLSRLWEHTPYLAVFMNYVLSNSDPSSLLFYLLTDLYKEGSAKDMRKWALEISTSFLVPGAPLRLSNVDENIAREVDEVMLKEYDKEEILRKIFWKARNRAKEELNEQLADFQQKRTAGLGTFFGPNKKDLDEINHDKAKEKELYESLLLTKLEPYLDEFDKETANPRRYITAAALATVITKVFGVRGTHTMHNALERCPMFVSKDKSLRTKLIGKYSRKITVYGHHYFSQQYFSVINCNNCHQVLYGIGPQGYQCSVCLINVHRQCVKQYDDACPGPMNKKDRGIGKLMDRIRPESKVSGRKPSAYFISMEREKRLTEEKDTVLEADQFQCDRPPGQPVSRSSSDKRPDAVTEEASRSTSDTHHESEIDHDITHDNLHNIQRAKSSQPAINRSESYKEQTQKRKKIRERRKISDPNLSKSNDVDSDHQELSYHSGSSSNSSLSSSRSSESPQSTSLDTVPGAHSHGHHGHGHHHTHSTASAQAAAAAAWDSDMDIDPDTPDWQSSVSEEILARLHPEEKKRQEIINELFHTERSHVRNLKVLDTVFYRPLQENRYLSKEQIHLLFSNLNEMLEIHGSFNTSLKGRRKEEAVIGDIGELLLSMFDGQAGETLKHAAARFCARQQLALESLKEKRRKDPRLNAFLSDCESHKLCKRLQLKDLIPTGMQRLVKYPLLFENLARCTERVLESTMMDSLAFSTRNSSTSTTSSAQQMGPTTTELERLRRALERSKEILNFVNQGVKEAEDKERLEEIQKRLDKTAFDKVLEHAIAQEFRNVDLTKHKLIHEGPLVWRLNKQNKISVHVVLLEEWILLLFKQDEKYILKFHNIIGQTHSPIVKVSSVLVRQNATEKESLYLVNTSPNGAHIYDLCAQSSIESRAWFKHISDAAEAYKSRDGKSRRSELSTPEPDITSTSSTDLSTSGTGTSSQSATTNGDVDKTSSDGGDAQSTADTDSASGGGGDSARNSGVLDEETASTVIADPKEKRLSQVEAEASAPGTEGGGVAGVGSGSKREALMRLATDDQPLIQPSEVLVNVLPVHTAQPVITPIEQVRRKDEAIRQALAEKEALVAEILHVPPEDYQTIVDIAGDVNVLDKEPSELVLAAVNQANLLSTLVSESLNITESDPVLATSSQNPVCASSPPQSGTAPSIPSHKVQTVSSALNTQLTALLKVVKDLEDERESMRREVQKLREQIHGMHETQAVQTNPATVAPLMDIAACSSDTDIFHSAGDLANIEEDP